MPESPQPTVQALRPLFAWQVLRFIMEDKLWYPPGTYARYSDLSMIVLGLVVESVTGASLSSFVQHHIFTPVHPVGAGFWHAFSMPAQHPSPLPVPPLGLAYASLGPSLCLASWKYVAQASFILMLCALLLPVRRGFTSQGFTTLSFLARASLVPDSVGDESHRLSAHCRVSLRPPHRAYGI